MTGGVTVHVCHGIHDPVNWPGVYSAVEGSNFLWRVDGELVDPEFEGMPSAELEAESWHELPEAEPAWERFGGDMNPPPGVPR